MNLPSILDGVNISAESLKDSAVVIKIARTGLSGETIKAVVQNLGERELLLKILDTDTSNVSRLYRQSTISKWQSESILDVLRLFMQAIAIFENENIAKEWLHTSIPGLAGEQPINLCDTFEGRKLVSQALMQIEYGEFS